MKKTVNGQPVVTLKDIVAQLEGIKERYGNLDVMVSKPNQIGAPVFKDVPMITVKETYGDILQTVICWQTD